MALARAVEKIPVVDGKQRRGLLIALEGPTGCNIADIFGKIWEELDSNAAVITLSTPDWKSNNEETFRKAIAELCSVQKTIIEELNSGKLVVVYNHMLAVLAAAWRHNVFNCQEVQDVAGARMLLASFRDVIIPDITFMCMPGIETTVNRLVKNGLLENEDAYMYSEYRTEARAYNKMSFYVDDVYDLTTSSINTESEMLQRIVLSSVTDCFKPIKFYYA